jgi:hypothetical protein
MKPLPLSPNFVDKANRHYRRLRAKNPGLLPLVPGSGRVVGNGSKVELTTENGARLVYRVTGRIEYVATLERSFARPKLRPAPTPSDLVKRALDMGLAALADLERQANAAEAKATNVINIAAE